VKASEDEIKMLTCDHHLLLSNCESVFPTIEENILQNKRPSNAKITGGI